MSDNTTPSNSEWPGRATDSWVGNDPTMTAPIGPPPAGAPVGLVEPPAPFAEDVDWQGKYESERKRSRIFMAATALAAALLVGSLFYASAQGGSAGTDLAGQQTPGLGTGPQGMGPNNGFGDDGQSDDGQSDDRGLAGPGMGAPGMGGGMGVAPGTVEQFFAADGSLDSDAVAQFKEQLDAAGTSADTMKQALAAQIEGDVTRGHITAAQAKELLDALGLDASTADDSNGTGTGT